MKHKQLLGCILAFALVLVFSIFPAAGQEVPEDLQSAAAELREGIKDWENFITVTFEVDPDSFDGTQASAKDIAQQVLDLALEHTGVPEEGDYLRFNIAHMVPDSVNYAKQNDVWQFTVTYYIVYWTTAEQEAELDAEIENLVQSLNLKGNLTDYEKISAIYQYITSNVVYDQAHLDAYKRGEEYYPLMWSTYAAAVNKTAVCQGYATFFYRLALEAGIDNRIITGIGYGDDGAEDHGWNIVKLDGMYYCLDATWDAGAYSYNYLLKSQQDFVYHEADEEYLTADFLIAYPLAKQSYELINIENAVDGDYEYQVVNSQAILMKYTGVEEHVTVPAKLGGYPVYVVATHAFYNNTFISSLTFSEGIQIIESAAISQCENLKEIHLPSTVDFTASKDPDFQCRVICGASQCSSVETITVAEGNPNLVVADGVLYNKDMTILHYYPPADPRKVFEIPEGVLSIGAYAFSGSTHLKEVVMPDTVVRLQIGVFDQCSNLETINISNSCHWIDQFVFDETALESIHIPASVKMLYHASITNLSKINTITVDPENPIYYVVDDVLYANLTEAYIPSSSGYIPGVWLVRYPALSDAVSFTVPEGVIGIDQCAFDSCVNLTEIILPDSLQIIDGQVFQGCSKLSKIVLPENLREIGDHAFLGCNNLIQLVVPANVEKIVNFNGLDTVVFLGNAPEIIKPVGKSPVKIYYPAGNATWNNMVQMYTDQMTQWIECCEIHQFEPVLTEASCAKPGYTGQQCTICGLIETSDIFLPTGHNYTLGICIKCGESRTADGTQDGLEYAADSMMSQLILTLGAILGIPLVIVIIVLISKIFRKKPKQQ